MKKLYYESMFITLSAGLLAGVGDVILVGLQIFFGFPLLNGFQSLVAGAALGMVGSMAAIMYLNNHPPQSGKGKRQHSSTSIISRIKEMIHMPLPRKSCDS